MQNKNKEKNLLFTKYREKFFNHKRHLILDHL